MEKERNRTSLSYMQLHRVARLFCGFLTQFFLTVSSFDERGSADGEAPPFIRQRACLALPPHCRRRGHAPTARRRQHPERGMCQATGLGMSTGVAALSWDRQRQECDSLLRARNEDCTLACMLFTTRVASAHAST
jgi:hypothetical protein